MHGYASQGAPVFPGDDIPQQSDPYLGYLDTQESYVVHGAFYRLLTKETLAFAGTLILRPNAAGTMVYEFTGTTPSESGTDLYNFMLTHSDLIVEQIWLKVWYPTTTEPRFGWIKKSDVYSSGNCLHALTPGQVDLSRPFPMESAIDMDNTLVSQGYKSGHLGWDIGTNSSNDIAVTALNTGKVVDTSCTFTTGTGTSGPNYGNYVLIQYRATSMPISFQDTVSYSYVYILYAHLASSEGGPPNCTDMPAVNSAVEPGQIVGRADHTGYSSAPHLHLEIWGSDLPDLTLGGLQAAQGTHICPGLIFSAQPTADVILCP